jgi:hypothetical protein
MGQGFTKGIPLSVDGTLAANSDGLVPSQKAVKTYVDSEIVTLYDSLLTSGANFYTGTFSTNYKHLKILLFGRTSYGDTADQAAFWFNQDTSALYDWWGFGSTAAAAVALSGTGGAIYFYGLYCPGAPATPNVFGSMVVDVPNYATPQHKACQYYGGFYASGSGWHHVISGIYRSGTAISRISVSAKNGANFVAGSRLTVYGYG